MLKINPLLMTDGYKTSHRLMYPQETTLVYSNYTCRSVKHMHESCKDIVVFGTQYVFKYIDDLFKENFFNKPKNEVCQGAKKYLSSYLSTDYDVSHYETLHDLGYLPVEVKSLEEGTVTKQGIPLFTIKNTHSDFFWVTNFLETLISTLIWKPVHSASIAYGYRKILNKYAIETGMPLDFVNFQGHDFSFRGMQSPDAAIGSAMGFLTSFSGTDTLPVLEAVKYYYNDENVGFSVPASEHSVMCSHGKEGAINTLKYLMQQYPTGILSVVSDTWDLWKLITEYLPQLKEEILARDGKLVIRPDSGDPVDIICGVSTKYEDLSKYFPEGEVLPEYFEDVLLEEVRKDTPHKKYGVTEYENVYIVRGKLYKAKIHNISWNKYNEQYYFINMWEKAKITIEELDWKPSDKGVIELLWDIFGGTINEQGYKVLDPHIGAIYGDSITPERAIQIAERLKAKGFANQIVLGIGSYSMGYATRDSQGGAVKSTYVEVNGEQRPIFKDPVTDDGTKKSAKGLLQVNENLELVNNCSWEEEEKGLLKIIYKDGVFRNLTTLTQIRNKLNNSLIKENLSLTKEN